jgi:septal ring factor EnvC (AmiA/AmiB activator)
VKLDHDYPSAPPAANSEQERAWLEHELNEAQTAVRKLLRQIEKEQARHNEIARAYKMTVENLVEISRQNTELERERDLWRARAASQPIPLHFGNTALALTPDEISAIRRAMARLHHPDQGGDSQRMQIWNAALDALEP